MKISVITVCLNAQQVIGEALNSLYKENNIDFEHIIVDGFSKDETVMIINEYVDNRTKVYYQSPKGVYEAFNFGVSKATGDVVYFLNADDALEPGILNRVLNKFVDDSNLDMVYGDVYFFYPENKDYKLITRTANISEAKKGSMPQHQGMFVKKKWLTKYPFRTDYKSASDFDFFCKFIKDNPNVEYLKENKVVYVKVGGVSSNIKQTWREQEEVIKEHFGIISFWILKIKHISFWYVKKILKLFKLNIHKG